VKEGLPELFAWAFTAGWVGGLAVGLWKLYTSHLSKGEKAGVTVGIFALVLTGTLLTFRDIAKTRSKLDPSRTLSRGVL
jgi:hypothetical protein